MGETPGWVDPTPQADGAEPATPTNPVEPTRPTEPVEPPPAPPPHAAAPPPPAAAPLPPAWQYFTSPTAAPDGTPPPGQSSWGWQQPPPGQQGAPPQYAPNPPYVPNAQFGPPPQYTPDPRFGTPQQYGAPGQYTPPPQYGPPGQYTPPPQYGPPGQYTPPPQYGPPGQYTPPPQYGPPGQYGYPQYGPQYGQWGGYQQEYKPGIVPLRPLSVGEVLDGSFSTIRKYPRIVFGFAAVLAVIAALLRLGVGVALNNVPGAFGSTSFSTDTNDNGTENLHSASTSLSGSLLALVVNALCVALLAGVVTGVVGKAVIGQRADGHEIIAAVRQRWFGLLIVSILAEILPWTPIVLVFIGIALGAASPGLGILAGVLGGAATLVLGPLLWGRLALAVPIFILERRGPAASIARSWRLVRGAFWRTWGLRALVWLIVVVAGSILSAPLIAVLLPSALHGSAPSTVALVFLVIFSAIAWAVTQPLIAASLTVIYIDRRMRAEGLDVQLTQAARAATAQAAPVM